MKKLLTAVCMLAIVAMFTGCDTRNGRVDDNNSTVSSINSLNNADEFNRTESDRLTSRENNADRTNSEAASSRNHDSDSVVGDIGDMVGNGINDVTNGVEDLGDTAASSIEDITHNDETDTSSMMY